MAAGPRVLMADGGLADLVEAAFVSALGADEQVLRLTQPDAGLDWRKLAVVMPDGEVRTWSASASAPGSPWPGWTVTVDPPSRSGRPSYRITRRWTVQEALALLVEGGPDRLDKARLDRRTGEVLPA